MNVAYVNICKEAGIMYLRELSHRDWGTIRRSTKFEPVYF
jgi:hypothetical protein